MLISPRVKANELFVLKELEDNFGTESETEVLEVIVFV